MSKTRKHIQQLKVIRSMMERSSTFISLSGFAGIITGAIGLAAGILLAVKAGTLLITPAVLQQLFKTTDFTAFFLITMSATLLLALVVAFLFSLRKAKTKKIPLWTSSSKNFSLSFFFPLLVGGILTAVLLSQHQYALFFPVTLIFYGMALFTAGVHTVGEIRTLGVFQTLAGLVSILCPSLGLMAWMAGFGLMNMAYGSFMHKKYGL